MRLIQIVLFLCISITLAAQNNSPLDSFIKNPSVKNAAVSICFADAKSDSVICSTNPQLVVVPASVQKLITSATALEVLGGGRQFPTYIWANGTISNGRLNGDLVITGSGDPTLGSGYFVKKEDKSLFLSEWVHWIKKRGIDTISGNIIADPYYFTDQDAPGSWLWEDVGNHYGAAASGLAVYDNIFEIVFNVPSTEGKPSEVIHTIPEIPGLTLRNEVVASPQKSDEAYVYGSPFDTYRVIKGTLPAGSKGFAVKASVPDPALLLASQLKKALTDSKVVVSGDIDKRNVIAPTAIDTGKIVVMWISPTVNKIIEQMNKESVNLYAETLMKHIGIELSGEGSTTAGTKAIKEFWQKKGIDTENLFLTDGSGLSRADGFTAKTLTDILVYMRTQSKWYDNYLSSIPLTGIEGTQQYYFQDSFLKGKAHAKTGSMTRVRSMAGYMTTQKGREVAFAIMINNYNCTGGEIKAQIEKLMEKVYMEY